MIAAAFYAPMKSPNHATPSGDREIARSVVEAMELAGFKPTLVSDFRSLDMQGDAARQTELVEQANNGIGAIIAKGRRENWAVWLTYHNYYKAPDLLGPAVAKALGIPYAQIESTRARKRLTGPWAQFAQAAEAAAEQADVIFYSTQRDAVALRNYAPSGQQLVHLHPFLRRTDLPPASTRTGNILVAGMMRPGDKLESYRIIADTLALTQSTYQMDIAGDGKAKAEVDALLGPFAERVRFLGQLDSAGMAEAYGTARLFFWPGYNEAIGMVYLEAQAVGIPVLAQNRPGLIDVLAPHLHYPPPDAGPKALAARLDELMSEPADAVPIRDHVARHHLLPAAANTLRDNLHPLIKDRQ